MLLKRVLKHKTSFICYFEFHDLYLFTFSRLKSLPCPNLTSFAGQLAHVIGPLKCYNDDYQLGRGPLGQKVAKNAFS